MLAAVSSGSKGPRRLTDPGHVDIVPLRNVPLWKGWIWNKTVLITYSHSVCLCTQVSVLLSSCTICVQRNAPFLGRLSLGCMFLCHKWECLKLGNFYRKCHFSVPILVCHKERKAWRGHRNVRTTAEDSGTSAIIFSLSFLWSQCKPTLTLASAPVFSSIRILLVCLFLERVSPFISRLGRIVTKLHTLFSFFYHRRYINLAADSVVK